MKVTTDTSDQPKVPQQAPPEVLQVRLPPLLQQPHVVLQHTAQLPQPPHLAVQPQPHKVRTIAVILHITETQVELNSVYSLTNKI